MDTIEKMVVLLSYPESRPLSDFKKGTRIIALNKMDRGNYSYTLSEKPGNIHFDAFFTPSQMLELGVFEGKYLNDCVFEFPREWFEGAIKKGTLSPHSADIDCNYFKIKSRMPLGHWEEKGWIYGPDNRGWFQWYCRYWLGRRIPEIDAIQISRWNAFKRHWGAVRKNCPDLECRPKQRQALLQWSWDCFVVSE